MVRDPDLLASALVLDLDHGDPGHDLGPDGHGGGLALAGAPHHLLESDVEVVLGQTGLTLTEVRGDAAHVVRAHLAVEVLEDPVQDLGAVAVAGVGVVGVRGHDSSWVPKPRPRA